ncbi:MAG: hypothetical protein GF307_00975 [candidate division Zixibacteria bacterium]|nr:hypothetical protein [candidate division Zixibacteria bacterium]
MKFFATLFTLMLIICGCASHQKGGSADEKSNAWDQSLELKILSRSTGYAMGSPFDMKMSLTNISSDTIKLQFAKTGAFDFFIYRKNELVYRYSEDGNYPTGLKSLTLAPGESKILGGIWNSRTRMGHWVRGGRYKMIGIVNTDPLIISDILEFGLHD